MKKGAKRRQHGRVMPEVHSFISQYFNTASERNVTWSRDVYNMV